MTVRLLLMRHAKSSWKVEGQKDHERPLNKRGREDAPGIARRLQQVGWVPELALVSDAARTEETWAWMTGEFTPSPRLELLSSLYHGDLDDIRAAVRAHVGDEQTVLVLGHNPGWEAAVAELSGRWERFTTANVALLEHQASWGVALERTDWSMVDILRPRPPRLA